MLRKSAEPGEMPIVAANGIDIAYDEVGDKSTPAIVLIMGLGTRDFVA